MGPQDQLEDLQNVFGLMDGDEPEMDEEDKDDDDDDEEEGGRRRR